MFLFSEIEEETRNSYQKLETRLTECQGNAEYCVSDSSLMHGVPN